MDRQQFIQQYGIRGHSLTFIALVYGAAAFLLLPNSADVPDEWWQSLEIAYQQAYAPKEAAEGHHSQAILNTNSVSSSGEFPDGPFFTKEAVIPIEQRASPVTGPVTELYPQQHPTAPVHAQLAYGVKPWEWTRQNQLRPFTYPMPFYWVFRGLRAVEDVVLADERRVNALEKKRYGADVLVSEAATAMGPAQSPFVASLVSLFVPGVMSHDDAVDWVRSLFYIIPKLLCVLVAILLHKSCCTFGRLVFEEIQMNLPRLKTNNTVAAGGKAATSPSNSTPPSSKSSKNAASTLLKIWDADVIALRESIFPTTAEKFNKRVSIFALTNFMMLYMSSRSLSNMPEALVFMWCLGVYAQWRVDRQRCEEEKLRDLAALIGDSMMEAATVTSSSSSSSRKKVVADSSFSAGYKPLLATITAAAKLLFIGGFGCALRTTMAVPFAGIFMAFVLDAVVLTLDGRRGGGTQIKFISRLRMFFTVESVVKRTRTLLMIAILGVFFSLFWLAVVLAVDSWYYCGTAVDAVIKALGTNPMAVAKDLFAVSAAESSASCMFAFTPLNFYKFNFHKGHSSFFGSHPWWWYFALGAPASVGANIVFIGLWVLLKATGLMDRCERSFTLTANDKAAGASAPTATTEDSSEASSSVPANKKKSLPRAEPPMTTANTTLSMRLVASSPLLLRLGAIVFASVAVYSLLAHKEMRFVFPFVAGPSMVACAVMYEEVNNFMVKMAEIQKMMDAMEAEKKTKSTVNANEEGAEKKAATSAAKKPSQPQQGIGAAAASLLGGEEGAQQPAKKKEKKTVVQRLALICLIANGVGLIVIGKAFKVGPPAVAHYFRSKAFMGELAELRALRGGGAAATTALPMMASDGAAATIPPQKASSSSSHLPSLHVWAGCYSLPGPSYYHHVFRSIRAVSCNTMAVSEEGEGGGSKQKDDSTKTKKAAAAASAVTPPRRFPTEHELFLQFPEAFISHVYGRHLAAMAKRTTPSPTVLKRQRALRLEAQQQKRNNRGGASVSGASSSSEDGGAANPLTAILKSLQSKAAQDNGPLAAAVDGGDLNKSEKREAIAAAFNAKLQQTLEGIAMAKQQLRYVAGASSSSSVDSSADLYGGILGFEANTLANYSAASSAVSSSLPPADDEEPLPDVIVMFSTLSAAIDKAILVPLGYTMRKSFYHTFAVVDEGSGPFIEVWMRDE